MVLNRPSLFCFLSHNRHYLGHKLKFLYHVETSMLISLNCFTHKSVKEFVMPKPELEESYLCDPRNRDEIAMNISRRKGIGNIDKVLQLYKLISEDGSSDSNKDELLKELSRIPNRTHPEVVNYGEEPKVTKQVGSQRNFDFKPKQFHEIANAMNILRNDVTLFTGQRSYFFIDQLSHLESAIVKFSLAKLLKAGFQIISVPDILDRSVIESCGMETRGVRSQVYSISPRYGSDKCLSGTAEMALAAYLMNKDLKQMQLPLRLVAVSRCYRAEASRTSDERGIYRVHQFTKVEMFGVSELEQSSELLEQFRDWQVEHFAELGLQLRLLDMPPHELGAQAFRKYDVEAWLPAKRMWAELSSCSDCTDYQSRRLAIRSNGRFVHTVNGTACAVPRLVIALMEQHQQRDGSVLIPPPLRSYMGGATHISRENTQHIPALKAMKRLKKKS